jgi:hypothetical protein
VKGSWDEIGKSWDGEYALRRRTPDALIAPFRPGPKVHLWEITNAAGQGPRAESLAICVVNVPCADRKHCAVFGDLTGTSWGSASSTRRGFSLQFDLIVINGGSDESF